MSKRIHKTPDSNPQVYIKQNNRYVSIGRLYDRDIMWYGNYYVYCKKYSRGMRSIEYIPAEPDFQKMCAALDIAEDLIVNKIIDSQQHWTNISAYEVFTYVRASVLEAFDIRKKEILLALK